MKFLIYSFNYDWRVGGIVVLNKLADLIAELGYNSYVIDNNRKTHGPAVRINLEEAFEIAKDPKTFVIYPEVIVDNPLKAKNVCRWILYFPGVNGGEKTYHHSEFVFVYNKCFAVNTPYSDSPEIKIVDTMLSEMSNLGINRTKDAILIKKGSQNVKKRKKIYIDPHKKKLLEVKSADKLIARCVDIADYNRQLNEIRYFISYDNYTYHNILAALAGCTSIVIPELGKSKEEYLSEYPERAPYVSYGFDENFQFQEIRLLQNQLKKIEINNLQITRKLVDEIQKFFKQPT
jgi:hypothetical protein